MSDDVFAHQLAFALIATDHFSGAVVAESLSVTLDTSEAAVSAPSGGVRQADGSYRWIDLKAGPRAVTVASPSGRWTSWIPGPVAITLPLANPGVPVSVPLWPTSVASAPPSMTAVRGRVAGVVPLAGLRVSIAGTGSPPSGHWTLADDGGEFLYLLPGGPWPLTAAGALDLTISVVGKTVNGSSVSGGGVFLGARFEIPPQREMRVVFQIS